jgi:heparanase 1
MARFCLALVLIAGSAAAAPATCTLERVNNHVYGTSHFETPTVTDADACCSACAASTTCKAYSFRTDTGICYMKDNDTDGGAEAHSVSGRAAAPPAPPAASCTTQAGVEYLGNDLVTPAPVADEGACCDACAADAACQFFTYEGPGPGGLCHRKNTDAPDYSRQNASCTSGFPGTTPPAPSVPANVTVAVGGAGGVARSRTGANFVCWNIDASENRGFFWRNLSAAAPYGAQLARQAAALGAAQEAGFSLLRFGGSGNDYLTYAFNGTACPAYSATKTCLNETAWRALLSFTEAAKAKMVFGLSYNTGEDYGSGGYPFPWDPSNARAILRWTIDNGLDHLFAGFELGNEQNDKYTGAQQAQSFKVLHDLTVELWPDESARPPLYGPDPHSYHGASADGAKWIADWLDGCAKLGVPLAAATHHEYTEIDPTPEGFTSPAKLDVNGQIAEMVNRTVREHSDGSIAVFGGEIGPHNGGSPACNHSSMRWAVFGDSLWYADALSAKAYHGYQGFCRQDYIGADYGLLDCSTGAPLPDFYTALSWSTTMGRGVLGASLVDGGGGGGGGAAANADGGSSVRVYAHCTAAAAKAKPGAVTVLVINVGNKGTRVSFADASLGDVTTEYVLAPSDDPASSLIGTTGLLGTGAKLNGELLVLGAGGAVPLIVGKAVGSPTVIVPATSIAFLVLEDAQHPACTTP